MRVVFVDDSEQTKDRRTGRLPREGLEHLLALGAVSFDESKLRLFTRKIELLREQLGIPEGEELKWKPRRGSFLDGVDREASLALRRRMLQAAAECEVRSMVVIFDRPEHGGMSKAEAARVMLMYLFERIRMHLEDSERGVVITDKPGGGSAEEASWLADSQVLTKRGTEYVDPTKVVLPILTAPSDHVPHLQLADLVTAATTAAVAGRRSGLELVPGLVPLIHRNVSGTINGAGVVLRPDHKNLYHWVFGETHWARVAEERRIELPIPGFSWGEDDGLADSRRRRDEQEQALREQVGLE